MLVQQVVLIQPQVVQAQVVMLIIPEVLGQTQTKAVVVELPRFLAMVDRDLLAMGTTVLAVLAVVVAVKHLIQEEAGFYL
jgi:hypothetical protein